jgi:hypothetical protein
MRSKSAKRKRSKDLSFTTKTQARLKVLRSTHLVTSFTSICILSITITMTTFAAESVVITFIVVITFLWLARSRDSHYLFIYLFISPNHCGNYLHKSIQATTIMIWGRGGGRTQLAQAKK